MIMKIGIDLGTTYSCAAYIKDGQPEVIVNSDGNYTMPSVVLFEDESNIVVGENAKDQMIISAERIIANVKDSMGTGKRYEQFGKQYSPEEISAIILKKIIQDCEASTGEKVDGIVVTIPAYFNDAQRKATADACSLISAPLISMINEPTAAALFYLDDKNNSNNQNIMVYDLGGGTFDVSIVNFSDNGSRVVATNGLRQLGGHFFDQLIVKRVVDYMEEKHHIDLYSDELIDVLQELSIKAEKCKIQLSSKNKASIILRIGNIKETINITREEFNSLIDKFYRRTESIIRQTLSDANMSFDNIDKIVLVGGSSRIPYIREQLRLFSSLDPVCDINPDEAVCCGAAIHANAPNENKITDVCSHSLGIELLDKNSVIIPRNSPLPVCCNKDYVVPDDDITSIIVWLTEGEGEDMDYVNRFAKIEIDIPANTKRGTPVEVQFNLDENQLLNVKVLVKTVPEIEKQVKVDRKSNLTYEDILKKKSLLASAVVT